MGVFRTIGNILVGDRVAVKYGLFLQGEFLLPEMGAQVCEMRTVEFNHNGIRGNLVFQQPNHTSKSLLSTNSS